MTEPYAGQDPTVPGSEPSGAADPPPAPPPTPDPPPPPAPPPPPGAGTQSPPFAARYGLVRPLSGRYLAGVCAALGQATRSDPVLWRVLLSVLVLFGGVGLLVYLVAWLLIPAEGDTASPLEAALGRGQSGTSPVVVVVVSVAVTMMFLITVFGDSRVGFLGLLVVVGLAVWLTRRGPMAGQPPVPMPGATPGQPGPGAQPMPPPADAAEGASSTDAAPTVTLPGTSPTATTQPLTPHGPFATSPYAASLGYTYPPDAPAAAYPGLKPPGMPPQPPRPRRRSALGRLTLSLLCIVIGIAAIIDLSGINVTADAYFAVAVAVVGLGLLAGSWFGRSRGLIPLGVVLALALLAAAGSGPVHLDGPERSDVVWAPNDIESVEPRYHIDVGSAVLDLSKVSFEDHDVTVTVNVDVGNITVVLPDDVDVVVKAKVGIGQTQVLDESWGGVGGSRGAVSDLGRDGKGGGNLELLITLDAGHVEVSR
ncbi:MAG: PspC domain-containing protein [Dactylosporangium sp.]|nr:PspC domain-containing protein [Dactylosporangium sp.]NNJ59785.1 PspC domain-containing protein [Dactylosporangium sp.]